MKKLKFWYVYRIELENDGVDSVWSSEELAIKRVLELDNKRIPNCAYQVEEGYMDSGRPLDGSFFS